jgi:4-amino-4-deoxy-L-arabinose transferase-like glycosyltransferase
MRLRGTTRPLAAGVLAAAALLYLVRLGAIDLWAPDEPRYAQVAEELRAFEHGPRGLWLLHLNGEPYTQKPPVYFWLAALLGAPGGHVGPLAARLPSALAGVACVALAMGIGARLRSPAIGIAGAALLATSIGFAYIARRVQLDVLLCAFELAALSSFLRIDGAAAPRRRDVILLHASLGLAVLTKGPIGLITPLFAIVAFLAWERRLGALRRLLPPWAPLLSVAPGLVWIAGAIALAPAGFADEAITENLWDRFAKGTHYVRGPAYYLHQFPVDFLPWSLLAPLVLLEGRRALAEAGPPERARAWRFLLAWLGTAFVFFSASTGKRGLYLLPALPAAALLTADAALGWLGAARAAWLRRGAVLVGAVAAAELLVFCLVFPALDAERSPRAMARTAAALAGPGGRVGVTRTSLVGALLYYGGNPVAEVKKRDQIERFLAEGGRVLVTQQFMIPVIEGFAPVEVHLRPQIGYSRLVVVTPVAASADPPQGR